MLHLCPSMHQPLAYEVQRKLLPLNNYIVPCNIQPLKQHVPFVAQTETEKQVNAVYFKKQSTLCVLLSKDSKRYIPCGKRGHP